MRAERWTYHRGRHRQVVVARSARRLDLRHSPSAVVASLWENRRLVWQLTKREVVGRYRGSLLGLAWSLFHPLLMLSIYTLVFGYIFHARWGGEVSSTADFAIVSVRRHDRVRHLLRSRQRARRACSSHTPAT